MSRYIQSPDSKPAKATKPKELPKTGKYTSADLEGTKKILSNTGKF